MEKSITIRHVPDATCAELAARGGRSLQEYLLLQLVEIAGSPDADTVVAGMRARKDAEVADQHRSAESGGHARAQGRDRHHDVS